MKLPTIQPQPATAKPHGQAIAKTRPFDSAWHALRVMLLLALILSLHSLSASRRALENGQPPDLPHLLAEVQQDLPLASNLRPLEADGLLEILDAQGERIGALATTSPQADRVVGYSGPNNVLLILDSNQSVVSSRLLSSGDTQDHVALVINSAQFWQQFVGRSWGSGSGSGIGAATNSQLFQVDGVSGATLTSLAIVEAIEFRMGGQRLNLRFPNSPTLAEAQALAPETTELVACTWHGRDAWEPRDNNGKVLGTIVRTGNLIDSVEGYQGPTELLLWFDSEEVLRNVKLGSSYDNQPYVGYVQQEYSFWPLFKQRTLTSLATIDLEAERIEGVSGATMTSMAVAQTIQLAAEHLLKESTPETALTTGVRTSRYWNWSLTEIATAAISLVSIPWSRWRLRGRRLPRLLWQATCLLVLGIAAGNLISLALLAGWTRGGVPLRLAPGLVTLLAVALVWPVVTKSNVYCDQLCPHGIVQQWIRLWRQRALYRSLSNGFARGQRSQSHLSRWLAAGLKWTSYGGVLAAFGWVAFQWPIVLSALEPFNAYAWRVGWSLSCVIWIASMLLAIWRPMSYCQLACPTGRLLDVLRRSRRTRTSWWVEGVLIAAIASVWYSSL